MSHLRRYSKHLLARYDVRFNVVFPLGITPDRTPGKPIPGFCKNIFFAVKMNTPNLPLHEFSVKAFRYSFPVTVKFCFFKMQLKARPN